MRTFLKAAIAATLAMTPLSVRAQTAAPASTLRPDQAAFRDLYRELVETNTTLSEGSCTTAAQRMATRLRAAGYPEADVQVVVPPDHPNFGALTAILHGSDRSTRPILLLAHIDVVEARRADWERDPFTLVEEGGYFYARGASDDKAMASVWVDTLIRYRQEGFRPRRDIKLALTCGEETSDTFDGVAWLIQNRRDLMDAGFALNEGAGGRLDAQGNRVALEVQGGEKVYQDFTLVTTNPGGHSSRPVRDNAIYNMAAALSRLQAYDFAPRYNDTTRAYFTALAGVTPGPIAADLRAVGTGRGTPEQIARVAAADPAWNSTLRTTCVATMMNAGHAPNALPQRAEANVNCRVFPGQPVTEVQADLQRVLNDPRISITRVGELSPTSAAPPLTDAIMGPVRQVAGRIWPGVPIVPTQTTGATDGRFLNAAGIPTYGISGMFADPDAGHIHGLNERLRVRSLYEGRDFLYELVKLYAG